MDHNQFCKFVEDIIIEARNTLFKKSLDYSEADDRLKNFKEAAVDLSDYGRLWEPREVWYVYFWKHLSAIRRWVRTGNVSSEPLRGRFIDAINYLVLAAAMDEEQRNSADIWRGMADETLKEHVKVERIE